MKKYFVFFFTFIFFLYGCSGGSGVSNGNNSGNENGNQKTSTLGIPKFPVEINAPYGLDFGSDEGGQIADNFFDSVCISDMEAQVTTFKALFLSDEDLSELRQVTATHWMNDYVTVNISTEGDFKVVEFLFNSADTLGNNKIVMKYKPDYSYVEVVAYAQGNPTMSIKGNMSSGGNEGKLEYYSGKFEVLGDVFSYAVKDTMVTSKLEGYDNGMAKFETTLTEDNQSNPLWGECISKGVINGEWKLQGDIKWQGKHGHYVVIIYDAAGAHKYEGSF